MNVFIWNEIRIFISYELILNAHPVQIARGHDGQITAVGSADHGHRVGVDLWMRAQVVDGFLNLLTIKTSKCMSMMELRCTAQAD